jgi:hypothetical protein
LDALLAANTWHCGNYALFSRFLHDFMTPSTDAVVAMIGWSNGTVTNHSQLLIGSPGGRSLWLDPTIGHIALTDGYNSIIAGDYIPPEHQKSFYFRTDVATFREITVNAITFGEFRGGQTQYWWEYTDYPSYYGYSNDAPTPQREGAGGRATNNLTLSDYTPINGVAGTTRGEFIGGTSAKDNLFGLGGSDTIVGGASTFPSTTFTDRSVAKKSGPFFTSAQLQAVLDDPAAIAGLYLQRAAEFKAALGTRFVGQPEDHFRLAFAAVLAHDLKPSVASSAETSLPDLLGAAALDADSYGLLTWHLFNLIKTTPNPDVAMVAWHGGAVGPHVQLIISTPGKKAMLIDPTIAHLALSDGYNQLVGGEAIGAGDQSSFEWRSDNDALRNAVITSLDDGLYRAGHLVAWFDSPAEFERFQGIPHWAAPQGGPVKDGTSASPAIGAVLARDAIWGGVGGDALIGDGIVRWAGNWLSTDSKNGRWYVGDFDGDGKDDVFRYWVNHAGADMFKSTGTGFNSTGTWTLYGSGSEPWYIGDFNGDGRDDIMRYFAGRSGADVFLSTGTGFTLTGSWTGFGNGKQGWYVGDFNGDGKDDIFRYVPGLSGADMFLSTGSGFARNGSWTGFGNGKEGWYVGDFNGDGKDDIFRYVEGASGADMFLSTGAGFARAGSWTGFGHGPQRWTVMDVDGDGKDDIIGNPGGAPAGALVFQSTGTSFVRTDNWAPLTGKDQWALGDFNGDGHADFMRYTSRTAGGDMLAGNGLGFFDEDRFCFRPGELNGDTIVDFQGAGSAGGDQLWFEGFGNRTDITLTNNGDLWTISNATLSISETFRIIGVTALGSGDVFFV